MILSEQNNETFVSKTNKISFILLCIALINCTITGAGRIIEFGFFTPRIIVSLLAFVFAVPTIISNFRSYVTNPFIILLAVFIVYLFISAYRGYVNNCTRYVLISDLKGYLWLFFLPLSIAVINSKKRIDTIIKLLIIGALAQAVIIIGLNIWHIFTEVDHTLFMTLNEKSVTLAEYITESMFRIFFKSGPYIIVGCILSIYMLIKEQKFKTISVLCLAFSANAILISFTRSFYFVAAITILFIFIYLIIKVRTNKKKGIICVVIASIISLVLIFAQQLTAKSDYFDFAVKRCVITVSDELLSYDMNDNVKKYLERTQVSDTVTRGTTSDQLEESIQGRFIFGNGLGKTIALREVGLPEYYYQDTINKIGIVGLFLYYSPILYMIYLIIKFKRKKLINDFTFIITIMTTMAVFLIITYFNPYMNAALGIVYYSIVVGIINYYNNKYGVKKGLIDEQTISDN